MNKEYKIVIEPTTKLTARILSELDAAAESDENINYKPIYYYLFNGITDISEEINSGNVLNTIEINQKLKMLQIETEEMFISSPPTT